MSIPANIRGAAHEVWSCGGGTQSVAIAALIIQGRIPKPDLSVIVDTGREIASTWRYYDTILYPALLEVGVELHRVKKERYATTDLLSTNGKHIQIPAFTFQTGEKGKLSNFCTGEWKTRVINRFLREQGIKTYRQWIGFSIDEPRRFVKHLENPLVRLPLVRDVPMRRQDCIRMIARMGWPITTHSRCWMCPNQRNDEWMELQPEEFLAAVQLERNLREKDPFIFLHESGVPLDQVNFNQRQSEFFAGSCASGECFL